MSYEIKRGDLEPPLTATLTQDGTAIDLTTATSVRVRIRHHTSQTIIVDAAATVTAPANGQIRHTWSAGQTDKPGACDAEFVISWAGGREQTVPSNGLVRFQITDDLQTT